VRRTPSYPIALSICAQKSDSISPFLCFHSDPEDEIPIAKALYGNDDFMRAFYNSLSDDGILVMQLGEAPRFNSPDETYSKFRNRATTTTFLENLGFNSIHVYEEVGRTVTALSHLLYIHPFSPFAILNTVNMEVPLWFLCTMDLCDGIQVSQQNDALVCKCCGS